MVDVDSVDKNVLSDLKGDVPSTGAVVDGLKLLNELFRLSDGSLAVADVLANLLGDRANLFDG